MKTRKSLTILFIVCLLASVGYVAPMGTVFTYQGRLIDANNAADGLYDFQFKLYDANVAGTQKGSTITVDDLDVIDGYFTVGLDFGSVFDGNDCWLQIGVRLGELNDPNKYRILISRQEVTPTPYAIYAQTAGSDGDWIISGNNMYSIPSGNVGIGTTNPISKLEVMSTEDYHGIRSTVPYVAVYGHRTGITGTWPGVHGETDSNTSGSAGVRGVANSTAPETLTAGVFGWSKSTSSEGIGVRGHHDGTGYASYFTGGKNYFEGNVGIGTQDPEATLQVAGSLSLRQPGKDGISFSTLQNGEHIDIWWSYNFGGGVAKMRFYNDKVIFVDTGEVGICTELPAFTLHVNGSAGKPGGGSWSNASDISLKKNIHTIDGALERLLQLRGVTFEYKEPEKINELSGVQMGMVAQEVEKVFPQWVNTNAAGFKTVTFRGFESLVVEALRELCDKKDAQIKEQQQQIDDLNNRLSAIETLVSKLSPTQEGGIE